MLEDSEWIEIKKKSKKSIDNLIKIIYIVFIRVIKTKKHKTEDTMQRLIITTTVTAAIIDRTATGMDAGVGA